MTSKLTFGKIKGEIGNCAWYSDYIIINNNGMYSVKGYEYKSWKRPSSAIKFVDELILCRSEQEENSLFIKG